MNRAIKADPYATRMHRRIDVILLLITVVIAALVLRTSARGQSVEIMPLDGPILPSKQTANTPKGSDGQTINLHTLPPAVTLGRSAHNSPKKEKPADAQQTWANTGTNFNTSANWNAGAGPAPGAGDVAAFNTAEVKNPKLSASDSIAGLYFKGTATNGYTVSATSPFVLTLTAFDTTIGTETGNSDSVAIGAENTSGTNTVSAPVTLAPASGTISTISQAAGGTLVISGVISDGGAGINLTFAGPGTLTLSGANTYTGGTSASSGVLQLGASGVVSAGGVIMSSPVGTGTLTLGSGATLSSSGGAARKIQNNLSLSGSITLGDATNTGALTFNSTDGTNTLTTPATVTLTADTTLTTPSVVTIVDVTSGSFALIKDGPSTLTLSGANTFTGGTSVNAGALQLGTSGVVSAGGVIMSSPVGTGTLTLGSGATLSSNASGGGGARKIQNNLSLSGSITLGDASNTGALTFNSTDGTNTLTTPATVTLTADTTLTTPSAVTIADVISGSFALTKDGSSSLTLNAANTFTGGVTIDAGTLTAGTNTALGPAASATLTFGAGSTGTFQLNHNNVTVIDLNTNATVGTPVIQSGSAAAGTDTLTVNTVNTDTYAGVLQDGGAGRLLALTKSGTGSLALSGTNTYTGGTTINRGTLFINGDSSAATGAVMVNNKGTLGGSGTTGGAVTVNAGGTIAPGNGGVGTLTLNNNLSFAGTGNTATTIATYAVDLSGATSDELVIGGNLTIGTQANNQISFTGAADGTTTYTLATYAGGETGTFTPTNLPAGYQLDYGMTALTLTPIPEPSTWLAAAMALGAVGYTQRKRLTRALKRA